MVAFDQLVQNDQLVPICVTSPFLKKCTGSKDKQKVVTCHIWQASVEEVDHLRHQKASKEIYSKRKETSRVYSPVP